MEISNRKKNFDRILTLGVVTLWMERKFMCAHSGTRIKTSTQKIIKQECS